MKNSKSKSAALLFSALLVSCGGPEPVDISIVDNNQIISKENATFNGRKFIRETYGVNAEGVTFMSDSSIKPMCRFGDGWATGKVALTNGNFLEIKCQTNGSGKGNNGCLTKEEFITKDYAAQDGSCDLSINKLETLGS